jgi:hypothetical protein
VPWSHHGRFQNHRAAEMGTRSAFGIRIGHAGFSDHLRRVALGLALTRVLMLRSGRYAQFREEIDTFSEASQRRELFGGLPGT